MPFVRVRVVDGDGAAASGAHLAVPWASVPFPEMTYIADEAGVLTLDLEQGEYLLRAETMAGAAGEERLVVSDDEERVVEVRVQAA